ncbi:hypothetical protein BD410DRAFT_810437 [Rickenella mellea]|uniref:Uncharacterized protein n=1 Tax=Rickenella mellea TaxID=50990 RepID=A0A4Y7PE29_9AGAM|nr:hypothetical protein BD410DRAFT_810437 [Rickenella mellea]
MAPPKKVLGYTRSVIKWGYSNGSKDSDVGDDVMVTAGMEGRGALPDVESDTSQSVGAAEQEAHSTPDSLTLSDIESLFEGKGEQEELLHIANLDRLEQKAMEAFEEAEETLEHVMQNFRVKRRKYSEAMFSARRAFGRYMARRGLPENGKNNSGVKLLRNGDPSAIHLRDGVCPRIAEEISLRRRYGPNMSAGAALRDRASHSNVTFCDGELGMYDKRTPARWRSATVFRTRTRGTIDGFAALQFRWIESGHFAAPIECTLSRVMSPNTPLWPDLQEPFTDLEHPRGKKKLLLLCVIELAGLFFGTKYTLVRSLWNCNLQCKFVGDHGRADGEVAAVGKQNPSDPGRLTPSNNTIYSSSMSSARTVDYQPPNVTFRDPYTLTNPEKRNTRRACLRAAAESATRCWEFMGCTRVVIRGAPHGSGSMHEEHLTLDYYFNGEHLGGAHIPFKSKHTKYFLKRMEWWSAKTPRWFM